MLLRLAIILLAIGAIVGIGSAVAWHYNDNHERTVTYHVTNQDGSTTTNDRSIVVVRDGHWRGRPFFPGFPLLIVGGVVLTVALVSRNRRHSWGGPHHHFEDWHRDAHRNDAPPPPPPPASPAQ